MDKKTIESKAQKLKKLLESSLESTELESVVGGQRPVRPSQTDTVTSAGVTKCCW